MANLYGNVHVEIPEPIKSQILEYARSTVHDDVLVNFEETPHITIKYGITTTDVNEVAHALGKFIPIRIMFGATKMFMADHIRPTDVVKLDVFGESLTRLRRKIEANLETVDTYKEYYPHCTLAFVNEFAAMQYIGSNPFVGDKVIADRVVFSPVGGNKKYILCTGEILDYEV